MREGEAPLNTLIHIALDAEDIRGICPFHRRKPEKNTEMPPQVWIDFRQDLANLMYLLWPEIRQSLNNPVIRSQMDKRFSYLEVLEIEHEFVPGSNRNPSANNYAINAESAICAIETYFSSFVSTVSNLMSEPIQKALEITSSKSNLAPQLKLKYPSLQELVIRLERNLQMVLKLDCPHPTGVRTVSDDLIGGLSGGIKDLSNAALGITLELIKEGTSPYRTLPERELCWKYLTDPLLLERVVNIYFNNVTAAAQTSIETIILLRAYDYLKKGVAIHIDLEKNLIRPIYAENENLLKTLDRFRNKKVSGNFKYKEGCIIFADPPLVQSGERQSTLVNQFTDLLSDLFSSIVYPQITKFFALNRNNLRIHASIDEPNNPLSSSSTQSTQGV